MNQLIYLTKFFAKLSVTSFGGGYSLIPLIEKELVTNKNWITREEITNIFAVAGSAPGAIAINAATLIGYRIAGFAGAIVSTVSIIFPVFVLAIFTSLFLNFIIDNPYVASALNGVKVCVIALIIFAAMKLFKNSVKDWFTGAIFSVACLLLLLGIHPLYVIALGIIGGLSAFLYNLKITKEQSHHA